MAPRIVIIGGGSYQWAPKLIVDIANTESLANAELVLQDIDPAPLAPMADFVRHVAKLRDLGMTVTTTTDQRAALAGADYIVVTISTGGFDSMRHDLEVPERHGIKQPVGDTVGPGGIMRALRNIPVLVGIARDMESICPDAWMLNITNPMTALCRAVTRETRVRCVGLCHELAGTQFMLTNLLDANFRDFDFDVVGVNHLPLITGLRINGEDAMPQLRALLADKDRLAREPIHLPGEVDPEALELAASVPKGSVVDQHRVKFTLFESFGVLPAAGDRHLVEFFPGFVTEQSEWGKRWGVALTTIADRERDAAGHRAHLDELLGMSTVPTMPSGEMVAPLIDSFITGKPRALPLNLPNAGQAPDLPPDVVVEAMCVADAGGLRPRDEIAAPPVLAEWLRRVVSSQEAAVDAAVRGDRDRAVDAMLLDPLAGRIDFDHVQLMTDEMLAATKQWLPQFA